MYGESVAFNIDILKRAGLSSIMPQDFQSFLLGATGSTIFGTVGNLTDAVVNKTEGTYLNALRSISPGLYNIIAAFEGETLGTRGRITSVYNDMYEEKLRRAGFKSVDESSVIFQCCDRNSYDYFFCTNYDVKFGDFVILYARDRKIKNPERKIAQLVFISYFGYVSTYAKSEIVGIFSYRGWQSY